MQKNIIVFDVDGVIIDSASKKYEAFSQVMKDFQIETHPDIKKLLDMRVNRLILSQNVERIFWISQTIIFKKIWEYLKVYEWKWKCYPTVKDAQSFIKKYHREYHFFTNTAMHKNTVEQIFLSLWLLWYFEEILWYDTGTKKENIEYILREYTANPKNILFIDDLQDNIDAVKSTWVHTLLFQQDGISLEKKVQNIFWKI